MMAKWDSFASNEPEFLLNAEIYKQLNFDVLSDFFFKPWFLQIRLYSFCEEKNYSDFPIKWTDPFRDLV